MQKAALRGMLSATYKAKSNSKALLVKHSLALSQLVVYWFIAKQASLPLLSRKHCLMDCKAC